MLQRYVRLRQDQGSGASIPLNELNWIVPTMARTTLDQRGCVIHRSWMDVGLSEEGLYCHAGWPSEIYLKRTYNGKLFLPWLCWIRKDCVWAQSCHERETWFCCPSYENLKLTVEIDTKNMEEIKAHSQIVMSQSWSQLTFIWGAPFSQNGPFQSLV